MKITLLALFFSLNIAYSYEVKVTDNGSIKGTHEDVRMLFGLFTEFLRGFQNGPFGMWAQEFQDRGFDTGEFAIVDTSHFWMTNDLASIEKYDGGYNENGVYGVRLKSSGNQNSGIYQNIFYDDTTSLELYVYARSVTLKGSLKIIIETLDGNTEIDYFETPTLTDTWKKYVINTPIYSGHNQIRIRFAASEGDTIEIDEASCMPSNNKGGVRAEFYQLIKELNIGNFRYPGGEFADTKTNQFEYAIGPIDKRKSPNINDAIQRMDFGYEEYFALCEDLDIEPFVVLNMEHEDLPTIRRIFEYCMADTITEGGKIRFQTSGRVEPYDMKWFELGNENWSNLEEYTEEYNAMYDTIAKVGIPFKPISNGIHWSGTSYMDTMQMRLGHRHYNYGYHPVNANTDFNRFSEDRIRLSILYDIYVNEVVLTEHIRRIEEMNYNFKLSFSEWWIMFTNSLTQGQDWLNDEGELNSSYLAAIYDAGFLMHMIEEPDYMELGSRTMGIGGLRHFVNSNGERVIYPSVQLELEKIIHKNVGSTVLDPVVETPYEALKLYDFDFLSHNTPLCDITLTKNEDTYFLMALNRDTSRTASINYNDEKGYERIVKSYTVTENGTFKYSTPDDPMIWDSTPLITTTNNMFVPPSSFALFVIDDIKSIESSNSFVAEKFVVTSDVLNSSTVGLNTFPGYRIIDMNGKEVLANGWPAESIDISSLSIGSYILIAGKHRAVFNKIDY
ncbi:MAG: hypothetical protein Kapaf2KO_09410 [Candidatus Kapaibacteriales bacterium]